MILHFCHITKINLCSKARANLNKNENLVKIIPQDIKVDLYQLKSGPLLDRISKTVSYEVNLTFQCSHSEVLLLSTVWSER